jgi:enoyl-CoA hydratase/carnithine racemase
MLDPGLIDGAEAYRLGLVHLLVDQAVEVEGAARAAAKTLALKPPEAIAETRRWLDIVERGLAHDGGRGVDAGLAASIGLVGGPEERRMLKAPTPRAR